MNATVITDDDAREIVSKNLRKILDGLGWSQGDLARRLNIGQKTLVNSRVKVSRWCRGESLPSPADLANISEITGCATDDLLKTSRG